MTRVLVLGKTGMLGRTVDRYLDDKFEVRGTSRKGPVALDAESPVWHSLQYWQPDYIINCIGLLNVYCRDDNQIGVKKAVVVNSLFPHLLAAAFPYTKILHITTDCVYDGEDGAYTEASPFSPPDFYGKSKLLGEVIAENWLNIRCSIIGPSANGSGLLEWVRSHDRGDTIEGYANYWWNGVTTLQFAQFCEQIINEDLFDKLRTLNHTIHYTPNGELSKCDLVRQINDVYDVGCTINPVLAPLGSVDRTLASLYYPLPQGEIREALKALKEWA